MRVKKVIDRLLEVLDSEKSNKKKKIAALEKLITKLEKKERHIRRDLQSAKSKKEEKKIKSKLKLCIEHRKKGVKALKALAG